MDERSEATYSNIKYEVDYRNVKHARLEYKTGHLLLILPKDYENKQNLLAKYKTWIAKKERFIEQALTEAKEKSLDLNRTNQELKNTVHLLVDKYHKEYGFNVNNIYFRRMRTKWGSHSSKGNLTINTLLKYLPMKSVEYVIFHEMAHSRERKHNERFWKIVAKKFEDYQIRENELLVYWFLVQGMICAPAIV